MWGKAGSELRNSLLKEFHNNMELRTKTIFSDVSMIRIQEVVEGVKSTEETVLNPDFSFGSMGQSVVGDIPHLAVKSHEAHGGPEEQKGPTVCAKEGKKILPVQNCKVPQQTQISDPMEVDSSIGKIAGAVNEDSKRGRLTKEEEVKPGKEAKQTPVPKKPINLPAEPVTLPIPKKNPLQNLIPEKVKDPVVVPNKPAKAEDEAKQRKPRDLSNSKERYNFFENLKVRNVKGVLADNKKCPYKISDSGVDDDGSVVGSIVSDLKTHISLPDFFSKRVFVVAKDCDFLEKASLPENQNIVLYETIETYDLNKKFHLTDEALKNIGLCICSACSGTNRDGNKVFRVFNSAYALREHCAKMDKIHDKKIMKDSVLNLQVPPGYVWIRENRGTIFYYLMKEEHLGGIDPFLAGWNAEPKDDAKDKLRIFGWNASSLGTAENNLFVKEFLDRCEPDVLMVNECRVPKNQLVKKGNYRYISDGAKTAIMCKDQYNLSTVLPGMNDEYNQVMRLSTHGGKTAFILYNVYIPPEDEETDQRIDGLICRLLTMKERYKNLKLVMFGDLNLTREGVRKRIMPRLEKHGFTLRASQKLQSFTRMRLTETRLEVSYLDYFITYGFVNVDFSIHKPIGKSDHWTLLLEIDKAEVSDLKNRRQISLGFSKVNEDAGKIFDMVTDSLINPTTTPVGELVKTIKVLRKVYKPRIAKKPRNIFRLSAKIDRYLKEKSKKQTWEELAKLAKSCSNEEYTTYLHSISKLPRASAEYFTRMRFYTQINKNVDILRELEIPSSELADEMDVVVDRLEMDSLLHDKFKKHMLDNGVKKKYTVCDIEIITTNTAAIQKILNRLDFSKAMSFDYIPGEVFVKIKALEKNDPAKYIIVCSALASLMNDLLAGEIIPEEIICSRLVCLNKEAGKKGSLDNIRPIAVNGFVFKILEKVIQIELEGYVYGKSDVICKKQIGFMRGLGCDVNLLRLRHRVSDVKKAVGTNNHEKYVLFVDLKSAYDSVNHEILFEKMVQKGFPSKVVNSVKKIYSSAKIAINPLMDSINVNRGVLQGSILSPLLFNVYIDDLVRNLDKTSFEVLAYADDIAVICKDRDQLDQAIATLSLWSKNNHISINKKKSGILVVHKDQSRWVQYMGYPIVKCYKYLGVTVDNQIDPKKTVDMVSDRINVYFGRNRWLMKKFCTPRSLIQLSTYYHRSRLIYGMNVFMDKKTVMDKVRKTSVRHIKSIMSIPPRGSTRLLMTTLGIPTIESVLFPMLVNNLHKYKNHFGVLPDFYDEVISRYQETLCGETCSDSLTRFNLAEKLRLRTVISTAAEKGIIVSETFLAHLNTYWFKYPDKRDHYVVKFFTEIGYFNVGSCSYCGETNSRKHVTNECPEFSTHRKKNKDILLSTVQGNDQLEMEDLLLKLYFSPPVGIAPKKNVTIVDTIKSFISGIWIHPRAICQGDKNSSI